jgi:hypothetical protein
MVRDANGVQSGKPENSNLEPYYRLIELQRQMIDLIRQNANTKRECVALQEQLERDVEAMVRSRRSFPGRLRNSASMLLKRLIGGKSEAAPQAQGAFSVEWSRPFDMRAAPPVPESPNPTS